ncbi:Hypothetical protein CINCED_3A006296, partial [Cinara cedri]
SGIKQGCPLSGLLFILAIDPVVTAIQEEAELHHVLAFADDLINWSAAECGQVCVATFVRLYACWGAGDQFPSRWCPDEAFEGRRGSHIFSSPNIGLKIARSKLALWQRIDTLKTFFYPSTIHMQRMGTFSKSDCATIDRILRPELKKTFYLPQKASGEFLYGSSKRGGCGIRLLAEDSDIAAVDSSFKLLTSPDLRLASDTAAHAKETTWRRLRKNADAAEVGLYLSGEENGIFRETRGYGGVANVWSRARNASKRLGVSWTVDGDHTAITYDGVVLRRKQRREVMRIIRKSIRLKRSETLTAKPDQGRAMECVAADLASTHFIKSGDFTRFADWRFIHRARLNLVPLNGSSSWRTGDRRCRRCGYTTESLSHVVDHYMRYTTLYMARHNANLARIKKAAGTWFQ